LDFRSTIYRGPCTARIPLGTGLVSLIGFMPKLSIAGVLASQKLGKNTCTKYWYQRCWHNLVPNQIVAEISLMLKSQHAKFLES
jgi:hypothetical protein